PGRGARAVRAPARASQRPRAAGGGIRHAPAPAGRQLPAGVLARGAGQHRTQPESCRQARTSTIALALPRELRSDAAGALTRSERHRVRAVRLRKEAGAVDARGRGPRAYGVSLLHQHGDADADRRRAHRWRVLVGCAKWLVGGNSQLVVSLHTHLAAIW